MERKESTERPASGPAPPESDAPPVLYAEQGQIAYITLNRPHKLNALSRQVFSLLGEHVTRFAAGEARVAILHGNGRAFAAGADIEQYVGMKVTEYADFVAFGNRAQAAFHRVP